MSTRPRRLGIRNQTEIELERYALKALRGDFHELGMQTKAEELHKDRPRKVVQALTG